MYKKVLVILFLSIILAACVEEPSKPKEPTISNPQVLVLCEGIWGSDNSLISSINKETNESVIDYYKQQNGKNLGDLAMDIVEFGDTCFVVMSTSGRIEAINKNNCKSLAVMVLPENSTPRKLVIINDSTAYVTLLFKRGIIKFNPRSMKLGDRIIETGPYPEGICYLDDNLFVANSGYGDLYAHLNGAGTLSNVVLNDAEAVASNKFIGKNLIECIADKKRNQIITAYYNLPSLKDSLGGIVIIDSKTGSILNRWETRASDITLSLSRDTLFFINGNTEGVKGISYIDLNDKSKGIKDLIINPKQKDIWYSLAVSPDGKELWVANAKSFKENGEILVYDINSTLTYKKKYNTGINPNKILFLK